MKTFDREGLNAHIRIRESHIQQQQQQKKDGTVGTVHSFSVNRTTLLPLLCLLGLPGITQTKTLEKLFFHGSQQMDESNHYSTFRMSVHRMGYFPTDTRTNTFIRSPLWCVQPLESFIPTSQLAIARKKNKHFFCMQTDKKKKKLSYSEGRRTKRQNGQNTGQGFVHRLSSSTNMLLSRSHPLWCLSTGHVWIAAITTGQPLMI